jgi:DNA repair exonuclease SbcCD ATPase subunit
MQSLSERKHKALIAALKQLSDLMYELGNDGGYAGENMKELETLFTRYQELLHELGDCIAAYHDLYKDLKINVLAPQLRQVRNRMDQRSAEYRTLKMHLVAVRSY